MLVSVLCWSWWRWLGKMQRAESRVALAQACPSKLVTDEARYSPMIEVERKGTREDRNDVAWPC